MIKLTYTLFLFTIISSISFGQDKFYLKNGEIIPELIHQNVKSTGSYSIDSNRVLVISDKIQLVTYSGNGTPLKIEDKEDFDKSVQKNLEIFADRLDDMYIEYQINTEDEIIYVVTSEIKYSEVNNARGKSIMLSKFDARTFEELDKRINLYEYLSDKNNTPDLQYQAYLSQLTGNVSVYTKGEYCLITHESIQLSRQSGIMLYHMKSGSILYDKTFNRSNDQEAIRFNNAFLSPEGIAMINITRGEYGEKESSFTAISEKLLFIDKDKVSKELAYGSNKSIVRNMALGTIENKNSTLFYSTNLHYENDQFVFKNYKVIGDKLEEISSFEMDPSLFIRDFRDANYLEKKKGQIENFRSSSLLYPKPVGTNSQGSHAIISFTLNYWTKLSERTLIVISYNNDAEINSVSVSPYVKSMYYYVPHVYLAHYDVRGDLNIYMNDSKVTYSKQYRKAYSDLKSGLCQLVVDSKSGETKSRIKIAGNLTYPKISGGESPGKARSNKLYQYMHYFDNQTILSVYRRDLTTNSYSANYYLLNLK